MLHVYTSINARNWSWTEKSSFWNHTVRAKCFVVEQLVDSSIRSGNFFFCNVFTRLLKMYFPAMLQIMATQLVLLQVISFWTAGVISTCFTNFIKSSLRETGKLWWAIKSATRISAHLARVFTDIISSLHWQISERSSFWIWTALQLSLCSSLFECLLSVVIPSWSHFRSLLQALHEIHPDPWIQIEFNLF